MESLLLLFAFLACFLHSCQGYKFYVGGKDGWVLKPSEPYDQWSQRNRFQVNDTIYFKYKKGEDSVLLVTEDHYKNCNAENPIKKMEDGDSEFVFDHSGPFHFITGNKIKCEKGQKLIVVVLAIRTTPVITQPPSTTVKPPSPVGNPPEYVTPLLSPSGITPTPTPTPTPAVNSPVFSSPAGSPETGKLTPPAGNLNSPSPAETKSNTVGLTPASVVVTALGIAFMGFA